MTCAKVLLFFRKFAIIVTKQQIGIYMKDKWTKEELDRELHRFFVKNSNDEIKFAKGLTEEQVIYIRNLLRKKDVLAIMPTGGGKSICYQLAGLLTPGTTIVISPLVALMQDQVRNLKKYDIPAACIFSPDKDDEEAKRRSNWYVENGWIRRKPAYMETIGGNLKFLYVTPERFRSAHFLALLRYIQVNLLILDEVHCMSVWGHDFRPSYLDIVRTINALPNRPVIGAFTATATREVKNDVISMLGLKLSKDNMEERCNTIRKELIFHQYNIPGSSDEPSSDEEWKLKEEQFISIMNRHREQCGIVFCTTIENVEYVYNKLQSMYPEEVGRYHASMNKQDRSFNFSRFVNKAKKQESEPGKNEKRYRLMVATNAFGMGIDKDDIRFVVHYNCPSCIENYYQEAGRAGRDKKEADCYLLFSNQYDAKPIFYYTDKNIFKGFRYFSELSRWKKMKEYVESKDPAKYIDDYFNAEVKKYDSTKKIKSYFALGKEIESDIYNKEFRMPNCLSVNRSAVAENIRKGVYCGYIDDKSAVLVSKKKKKSERDASKENYVEYNLKYKDELGNEIDYDKLDKSKKITYFDMMAADAVYTLMIYRKSICAKNIFIMLSGDKFITLTKEKKKKIDDSVRKMMNTMIYIKPSFNNMQQGIWYEPLQEMYEPFLPLTESMKGNNCTFLPNTHIIKLNIPYEEPKGSGIEKKIRVLEQEIVTIPALYRFAEGMMQFYTIPFYDLGLQWQKGLLINHLMENKNDYDEYKNCAEELKGKKEDPNKTAEDFYNELETIKNDYDNIKKCGYSFDNATITHFLLRRFDSMLSTKRSARGRKGLARRIRVIDKKTGISIFETLFNGIRDMDNMSNSVKNRMIKNQLDINENGLGAILSRMKHLGMIYDYTYYDDKTAIEITLYNPNDV